MEQWNAIGGLKGKKIIEWDPEIDTVFELSNWNFKITIVDILGIKDKVIFF